MYMQLGSGSENGEVYSYRNEALGLSKNQTVVKHLFHLQI